MSIRIEIAKTNAKKLLKLSQELIQMFQQKKFPTAFSAKDKNLPDTLQSLSQLSPNTRTRNRNNFCQTQRLLK